MLCDKGLPCSVFSPLSSTAKFCFGKYAINRNQYCQELSFCGSKCLLQRSPCPKSILRPTIGQAWSTMCISMGCRSLINHQCISSLLPKKEPFRFPPDLRSILHVIKPNPRSIKSFEINCVSSSAVSK